MNRRIVPFIFPSALLVTLLAAAASAQVQRTFVSGLGSDGNPCTRTAPCLTFTQAISQTNAGGEVYVLDSAGYGAFTITQSVTIDAPQGVIAGISVFSGDGIDINAGPTDTVILRGLTVNNQGSTGNGIVFNTGGTLHIESCVASGFDVSAVNAGILIAGTGKVFVKDTIARGNSNGMLVTAGTATVAMDRVQVDANSAHGLAIQTLDGSGAVVHAAIRNSSASGNGGVGIRVWTNGINNIALDVESCLMTNNAIGIQTQGSGSPFASISNCTITQNYIFGFEVGSGAILSRGNNTISPQNGAGGSLTPIAGR